MALLLADLIETVKVMINKDDYDELKLFNEIMEDFK